MSEQKELTDEEKLANFYNALSESVFDMSEAKFKPEDYEKPHQTEERLRQEEGARRLDQYLENKNKTLRGKQFMSREITNHLQSSFTQQNNKIAVQVTVIQFKPLTVSR